MGKLKRKKTSAGTEATPERLSVFERTADWVSAAMGRPTNIIVWLVIVIAWTAAGPYLAQHPFLPAWSVSTGWNFPLNLITTVAELFIGFLVAAASNRSERNLDHTLARISDVEDKLSAEMRLNTQLTQQIHAMQKTQGAILDVLHLALKGTPYGRSGSDTGVDSQSDRGERPADALDIGGGSGHTEPADAAGDPESPDS